MHLGCSHPRNVYRHCGLPFVAARPSWKAAIHRLPISLPPWPKLSRNEPQLSAVSSKFCEVDIAIDLADVEAAIGINPVSISLLHGPSKRCAPDSIGHPQITNEGR